MMLRRVTRFFAASLLDADVISMLLLAPLRCYFIFSRHDIADISIFSLRHFAAPPFAFDADDAYDFHAAAITAAAL